MSANRQKIDGRPSRGSLSALATPRKNFGQHFLVDRNILEKIVRAASPESDALVLEIGPGLGHLTRVLLESGARVVAVEVDENLAAALQESPISPNLTVLQGDFLSLAPEEWLARAGFKHTRYQVVANLPYYITSPILRQLLEAKKPPEQIIVLVQREVARQITARPPNMSLLAVSVQFYGTAETIGIVPAGAFYPRPKVDSAILRIRVAPDAGGGKVKSEGFFRIVRAGFSGRRKQLHNALANSLELPRETIKLALARAKINPNRRAETLELADWRRLYRALETIPAAKGGDA